jgi:plastocyanin
MRRLVKAAAAAVVAAGLVATPASMASAATSALAARVRAVDDDFRPDNVTIPLHGSVGWINRGTHNHTVTFDDGFDEVLSPGERTRKRFDTAGMFHFHCRFHFGMEGDVTVNP